jgi:hypothetical protein
MSLTVPMSCGVYASHLFPYPVPQTPPAQLPDPFAQVSATIQAPPATKDGQPIVYIITLTNPTNTPVSLSVCRGYEQTLDGAKPPSFSYELNCAAARPIPAHGSEPFVIEMPSYSAPPGTHTVCWSLDDDGAPTQTSVCTALAFIA